MEQAKQLTHERSVTKQLAINGLFIALTLVFTACINVQLPIAAVGGLIHLGNIPLFIGAMLYGKKTGALAGAFGMGLFDILSGWASYAPCTFITVGLMGFFAGLIVEKKKTFGFKVLAIFVALCIKLFGYYIYEAIVYHSMTVPLASIPGNTLQVLLAGVIVLFIINPLEKGMKQVS